MKNLILTLAFIFTGTFAYDANATILSNKCIDLAFAVDDAVEGGISYETFDAIVTMCEAMS